MLNNKIENPITVIAEYMNDYIFGENTDYINLKTYLEDNDIEIYYNKNMDEESYLRWNSIKHCPRIVLNPDIKEENQLLNVAYELGNLIMHWKWLPYEKPDLNFKGSPILNIKYSYKNKKLQSIKDKLIESQVNEFSRVFLMPEEKVLKEIKNAKGDMSNIIDEVVDTFGVSKPTAIQRLKKIESSVRE